MDGFQSDICGDLNIGKRVCVVSPELPCSSNPRLTLCTDFPEEARNLWRE
jgi:hypothetical protein